MSQKRKSSNHIASFFFSKLGAEDEEEFEDAADEPNNEAKKRGPGVGKKVLFLNHPY